LIYGWPLLFFHHRLHWGRTTGLDFTELLREYSWLEEEMRGQLTHTQNTTTENSMGFMSEGKVKNRGRGRETERGTWRVRGGENWREKGGVSRIYKEREKERENVISGEMESDGATWRERKAVNRCRNNNNTVS
jgi:hypothetical protein